MKTLTKRGHSHGRKLEVCQMATDRIIEALEAGAIPWKKTWKGFGLARNYVSKHIHFDINAILANLCPYNIPYFVTMNQTNGLRGRVKARNKSNAIMYWNIRDFLFLMSNVGKRKVRRFSI